MSDDDEKSQAATALDIGETPGLPLVEVSGRVKWFDVSKGYGFIVPDDGGGDVLIHVTVLRRDGHTTLAEGARVVAEAQRRERGRAGASAKPAAGSPGVTDKTFRT